MLKQSVSLADKFDLAVPRVLLTGTQAIVRLILMQHARDKEAGLNTAGYVTGYRGSPLAGIEGQMARAGRQLAQNNILFQPAINEDLAATALWGAQQAELRGEGLYDGVFGIWYGKGPGVDRSGDAFRHANHAGTSRHGGVLALMGDDHTCESSTSAHQSEFAFVDAMIPILNPAGVQEILDLGLYGFALSRYAGVWVGLKCVKDNVEATSSADGNPHRIAIAAPQGFVLPPGGLNIRLGDSALEKEARLHDYKRDAILAFARANKLDRVIYDGGAAPKTGIVTAGKSYLDTMQALELLGIDAERAAALGLRVYKAALVWPLEPEGINRFADGLDLIITVEEKRSLIETQIKEQLYGRPGAPQVLGKKDEAGKTLLPAKGALDPVMVALALGGRLAERTGDDALRQRVAELKGQAAQTPEGGDLAVRVPYFCAGCPHNSSTIIPEGSRAYAGIGCHYMVQWMDRGTEGFTQMGAEGANWIGEAPFSKTRHIFQNVGDGTYDHSGSLAIRAAIASGVTMTFKILFNDAVAMTGGQPLDGDLSVAAIARQMVAEGAERTVIVTDEPEKYSGVPLPLGVSVHHRKELQDVQRELRDVEGVTVLIYDQTCAAEKRRRRKRGRYPDPPERVFINERVCEGCGDCGIQSNCVAIIPVETDYGRKRAIDQSACNKDFSCLDGFCPSFVTVTGSALKTPEPVATNEDMARLLENLPEPKKTPSLDKPYSILITGVGGTGVVTIAAILGEAAHIEDKGFGSIDMTGLAQKCGAVLSHVKIAGNPEDITAIRASRNGADLILGADLVTSASHGVLSTMQEGVTAAAINAHEVMTATFTHDPAYHLPGKEMRAAIEKAAGGKNVHFADATAIAEKLLGDSIAANMFMLGFAYQLGTLPVGSEAIEQAIRLNGVATSMNLNAFAFGRLAAHDPKAVEALAGLDREPQAPPTLEALVQARAEDLIAYQDKDYAIRYAAMIARIDEAERKKTPGATGLAHAAAQAYYKLLAYKDEYEVARLFTGEAFHRALKDKFQGSYKLAFHLAPPIFASKDPKTGAPQKRQFGPWMMTAFKLLAWAKFLRGKRLDPFGWSAERRLERALIAQYEALLSQIVEGLSPQNHEAAVELAALPLAVRGFGHIKEESVAAMRARQKELLDAFKTGAPPRSKAA